MAASSSEFRSFRLSSDDFAERDRIEAYLELMARAILKIETTPVNDHALNIDFAMRGGDDFGLAVGTASPMRNRHLSNLADNDDVVLVVVNGYSVAEQRGREAEVKGGDAILTTNGEAGTFTGYSKTHLTNFRLKRSMLEPRLVGLSESLLRPIPVATPALRLLLAYAGVIDASSLFGEPQIISHMYDLAALVLGATRDAQAMAGAEGGGVRAARLAAIKADIRSNYAVQALAVADVAARQGVTPRYVQMLFEAEGTTFSEFLRTERLNAALTMLTDLSSAQLNISDVAYRCGFSDLSYFNRSFRQRFGDTPTGVRRSRG